MISTQELGIKKKGIVRRRLLKLPNYHLFWGTQSELHEFVLLGTVIAYSSLRFNYKQVKLVIEAIDVPVYIYIYTYTGVELKVGSIVRFCGRIIQ